MTIPTFQVWQFRVRDHLTRNGDTKKSRAALVGKFGDAARPLVTALLAAYDAEQTLIQAREAVTTRVNPLAALTSFLQRVDEKVDGFEAEALDRLPADVRKPVKQLLQAWSEARAKFDKPHQKFERQSEAASAAASAAETTWTKALSAARAEHAKLAEDA